MELPKTTENAKRVEMIISKCHRKEEHFFTHHFESLKCIRFVENNFCRERSGGGGLDHDPFLGPNASWLDQTGTMHN